MGAQNTAEQIAEKLLAFDQPIGVLSHMQPDADAFGSSLGLTLALEALGKKVIIVNETVPSSKQQFFPTIGRVGSTLPSPLPGLVVVLDCGDDKRVGDSFRPTLFAPNATEVINIDHHRSNNFFGRLNWVVPDASSTSELVFELVQILSQKSGQNALTKEVATCLFAGISADTGSFCYNATSPTTFRVAAALREAGADTAKISQDLYSNHSLVGVRLGAEVMLGLRFFASGRVAFYALHEATMAKYGASKDDTESLAERARSIEGVVVSAIAREESGLWKISMRSRDNHFNVSEIAVSFGGGGHICAAGFRYRKKLSELEAELLPRLEHIALAVKE